MSLTSGFSSAWGRWRAGACRCGSLLVATALITGLAAGAARAQVRTVADLGLINSESARYDAVGDRWLVSNIGERGAGNNGFITVVDPTGAMITPKWIAGGADGVILVDPLGMAIRNDTVYVADTTTVRTFDRRTGKAGAAHPVPGAIRLNDLTVDDNGTIYVTDSGNDDTPGAIFRIKDGKVSDFAARDPALERPNGIAVMADGNIVHGGRGVNLVVRSPAGQIVREMTLPTGRFDGIVALPDGALLVASQDGHLVYRVPAAGKAVAVVSDIPIPAAIGLDTKRNRMVVPQIVAGTLTFVDLP